MYYLHLAAREELYKDYPDMSRIDKLLAIMEVQTENNK